MLIGYLRSRAVPDRCFQVVRRRGQPSIQLRQQVHGAAIIVAASRSSSLALKRRALVIAIAAWAASALDVQYPDRLTDDRR
jgi:hypothetical protein